MNIYTENSALHDEVLNQNNGNVMLKDYPDVLNIEHLSQILGVSTKTIYNLLKSGYIECLKVGRAYRIPKVYLIGYINSAKKNCY